MGRGHSEDVSLDGRIIVKIMVNIKPLKLKLV
jgi:hypothetical protein